MVLLLMNRSNELIHCYPYKMKVKYSPNKKFISIKEVKD